MAERFFDTSAVAKRYRVEAGTPMVDALLAESGSRHWISTLSVVELHSVLARLVRTGQITAADFDLVRARFLADIAAGLWHAVPVTDRHFLRARQLIIRHGPSRNLRTLDAIQLGVAMEFRAAGPPDAFVCADATLGQVAAAEGLTVLNPEVP
jgi:predicted nucleic acid-binding protein